MEENKTYRIRTKVGDDSDKVIQVKLDQHYDSFEILSLKIDQTNNYKTYESDYGVVVGRVLANGGFGIPNAKVSIFIESDGNDNLEDRILYPYKSPTSKNADGVRYNLLTDFLDKACYQNVGTFPNKRLVLDNDDVIDIFDKYYRYTTVTNNAGDYMIFGVPTGSQRMHVDIDLSDIGMLSQRPRDMIYKGYNIDLFDSPNKFKKDTNLNSLAQIISQDIGLYVYPYWGDTSDDSDNIAVTRADINIDYKFEPTCVFMGSIITDTGSNAIGKNCTSTEKVGKMSELIAGEGSIEMIRKTIDGRVEEFQVKGNRVIDGDGVWCYQIPMNLDYIMTDEFGNIVPSDNPEKGIPTRTRVRFRISIDDAPEDNTARKRCRYLVPNNPRLDEELYPNFTKTKEIDYEFGTKTKDENYRDLLWNKVYTVKNYVPRLQKNRRYTDRRHTGIKLINHHEANNPMPYNNADIKLTFTYRMLCIIFKIFIAMIEFLNETLTLISLAFCALYKVFHAIANFFMHDACFTIFGKRICPLGFIGKPFQWVADLFWAMVLPCIPIGAEMCGENTTHRVTFFPGCGDLIFTNASVGAVGLSCITDKACNSQMKKEDRAIKAGEMDESERTSCIFRKGKEELFNCIETALAEDNDVVSLNFQNDWVNGTLYAPMWFRKITKKKSYFFGLFKRSAKDQWCEGEQNYTRKILRVFNPCSPERPGKYSYKNYEDDTISARYINFSDNKRYAKSCRSNCHKSTAAINLDKGLIVKRQTMLGQDVYYYKPIEYSSPQDSLITNSDDFAVGEDGKNGSVKLLFATDIVLLGSLNDCDLHGVPQFFKSLESTTFNMPPNILFADNEVTVNITEDDGKLIYDVTEDSVSEMTGMDWGNYNDDLCGSWKEPQDSGLFYSIGCSTIEMKPKSCVNLTRICEYGVSLDETVAIKNETEASSEFTPSVEQLFDSIVPDGFVSKDELYNDDERSLFATLNINGLKTERNNENGLMEYEFKHVVVDNFDKSLYVSMSDRQTKCNKAQRYNYVLEEFSKGYYDFRMGKKPYFYDKEGKLPRYENSFYFYFGLTAGKTALDKFNSQFTSDCNNDNETFDIIGIDAVGNGWCNEMSCECDGYVKFDLSAVSLPCDIIISSQFDEFEVEINDNEDELFFIGNLDYINKQTLTELDESGYVHKDITADCVSCKCNGKFCMKNGTYSVTITDNNGEIVNTSFVMRADFLSSYILGTDFDEAENVLLKQFSTYRNIAKNTGCMPENIEEININTTRGIGGTIAISTPYNSKTGDAICDFVLTISCPDISVDGYENGYNVAIKCFNWCDGNGGHMEGTISPNPIELLRKNKDVFIFGVPKGDETYTVTITELCDGKESNNIFTEPVKIKQSDSFKLFVNGVVDYDVIKHWKCGFDCDSTRPTVTSVRSPKISDKWWHMSDRDNYLWFNYIPYMDIDQRIMELLKYYANAVDAINTDGYGAIYNFLKNGQYADIREYSINLGHFLLVKNIIINNSDDNNYSWSPNVNPESQGGWERDLSGIIEIIESENESIIPLTGEGDGNIVNAGLTYVNWDSGVEISWAEYYILPDSEKENYTDKTTYSLYLECVEKGYIDAGDYNGFKLKLSDNSLVIYVNEDDCTVIVTVSEYNAVSYELKNPDVYSEYFDTPITQETYDGLGYYNKDDYSDIISQETYDSFEYVNPRTHARITKEEYDNLGYLYPPCDGYSITKEEYENGEFGFVKKDERCTILTNTEYDSLGYTRIDDVPNDPYGMLDDGSLPVIANQETFNNLGYVFICNGEVVDYVTKSDYDLGKFPHYRLGDKCDLISEGEYDTLGYVLIENIDVSGNVTPFSPHLNRYGEYDSLGYVYICDGVAIHEVTEQEYADSENLGYVFNCQFTYDSKHYLKFPLTLPVLDISEVIGDDIYDTLGYTPSRFIEFESESDVITFDEYMGLTEEEKSAYSINSSSLYDAVLYSKPAYGVYNDEVYDFCLKDLYYNSYALSVTDYISKQNFYESEVVNYAQLDDTDYVTLKNYYDSDKTKYRPLTSADYVSAKRFFSCIQCEQYLPLKDLYVLSDDMESYVAMLIKDVLECWRDANDDDSANGNAEDLINSVFNSLYDINESIMEEINSVGELKTEFIDETKKAFQLNCGESPQNIFFTATTKNKPVIYHGVYKDEILDEDTNLYKLDSKYTYTKEGSSIEVISIPTISYEDSIRFGNNDEHTGKKQNNGIETYGLPLCYASDNAFDKSNKKLCNFIAVINSRNRRIPNDVEPLANQNETCPDVALEVYKEINLTKKYFGYHIIDKIFEINHMTWACVDKVPYFKPLVENTNCIDANKAGVSMCMNGLFTGKLFNGNATNEEPYEGHNLLMTEFEQQTLGDEYTIEIFTGYDSSVETIDNVEDKMPTRRYVNSSPDDANKQYEHFRVTNSEDTAQEAKDDNEMYSEAGLNQQYVPVVNSEMDMIIDDKNGCRLIQHIDGRMKIRLSDTSINLCSTSLKNRKKGCKLDVFTDNSGNATDIVYFVFSAYDSEGNVRYPLNLTEERDVIYEREAQKSELTYIFDEFSEASAGLEPGSDEYNELVNQFNDDLDGYFVDGDPVVITDDISGITDDNNNIIYQIDESEYNELPEEEKAKYRKISSSICRKTKFDCKMTDGKKRFFTYEGGNERNLFSFYNDAFGYNRFVALGNIIGNIRGVFGRQTTTNGLVSKIVNESSDTETKSYGYGNTGEFTFDRINGYSDAYYVIAVTDRNQRAISPVYDFPYVCARLIFGIIYTKQETLDEEGAINGYEYVASPKATFDIANAIKEDKCNDSPNKLPDLNCIKPEQILYYFYYYPYDIEFVCDIDGTNTISGRYRHPAYRLNANGEMGGYQLFDIDLATYDALYKTYRHSNQKVGKTIRNNTTIIATDYTGLRHDVDWRGCKQSDFTEEQGCGHPYAHKTWVQVTWLPNCGQWKPSAHCDKFVDIEGGGCDKGEDGEYINDFFGTNSVYTKIFEVISCHDYNNLDAESQKKYRYKPSDVGDLYKGSTQCGWAESYDSNTDVSNNEIILCYDNESDLEELSMIYYALCGDDFVTVSWKDCAGNAIGTPEEMRPGTVISETEMDSKRPASQHGNEFKEWGFYKMVNGELVEDSTLVEYQSGVGYIVLPYAGDCVGSDVSEIIIKAICTQDSETSYTIIFSDSEDHSIIYGTYTFIEGETISYTGAEPTKEGKIFNGWLNSDNEAPGIATKNDTFYAQWLNDTPPVTTIKVYFYNSLDDLVNEAQPLRILDVDSDTNEIDVSMIPVPSQEGMTFKCWAKRGESNEYTNEAFIGAKFFVDTKFYAKYITNKITVCFDFNLPDDVDGKDASGNPISPVVVCNEIDYGTAPTVPTKPTLNGWDFSAWGLDGNELTDEQVGYTTLEVDTTYTALWTESGEMSYNIKWWVENHTDSIIQAVDVYLAFLVNGTEVVTESKIQTGGGIGTNGGHRWGSGLTTVRLPDGWSEMYAYTADIENGRLLLERDRIETSTGIRAGEGSGEYITSAINENYKRSYVGGERFIVVKLLGEPVPVTYTVTFNVTDTNHTFVRVVKTMRDVVENYVIQSSDVPSSSQLLSYANNGQNGKYNPNFTWNVEPVGQTITESRAFNAIFDINKFTAEFIWIEGVSESVVVTDIPYGDYVPSNRIPQASQAPSREGYTFIGWDKDPATTAIIANTTFYGVWNSIGTYTVTFINGDTQESSEYYGGSYVEMPSNPTQSYLSFVGWLCDVDGLTYEYGDTYGPVTQNTTFTAQWRANIKFKVQDENNESDVWDVSGAWNKSVIVPYVVKAEDIPTEQAILGSTGNQDAYEYDGWKNGSPEGKTVNRTTTFTAYVYKKHFKVTFVYGNGQSDLETWVDYDDNVTMPQDPTYAGHAFNGWVCSVDGRMYTYSNPYTAGVRQDITFGASWSNNQVTVRFFGLDSTTPLSTQTVNYDSYVTPPTVTIDEGSTLKRFKNAWTRRGDTSGTVIPNSWFNENRIRTNMDFDGKFVNLYKVRFYTPDSGNQVYIIPSQLAEENWHIENIPTVNQVNAFTNGKTFMNGWRIGSAGLTAETIEHSALPSYLVTEEVNFFARFACAVTFDFGTPSSQPSETINVEMRTVLSSSQIPTPNAVEGYTFTGWDGDTTQRILDNITFTAQWVEDEPQTGYTVVWYKCDGSVLRTDTNVEENTVYGVTEGRNYPNGQSASTFSGGVGCLFGGEWRMNPSRIDKKIVTDTEFTPVCSCSGQTYTIKFGIHNNMDGTVQFNKFSVSALNYTLGRGSDSVSQTVSYSNTINYGEYKEIIIDNVNAFSEIQLNDITIKYDSAIDAEATLMLNSPYPDEHGYLAEVKLYIDGSPISGGTNITSTTFAQSQNGIYMTVVISYSNPSLNLNTD